MEHEEKIKVALSTDEIISGFKHLVAVETNITPVITIEKMPKNFRTVDDRQEVNIDHLQKTVVALFNGYINAA
jgi:hypothetical protein